MCVVLFSVLLARGPSSSSPEAAQMRDGFWASPPQVWGCESWQLGYSLYACASPVPVQLQLWAQQQIPPFLQTTFVVLKFKGSFWQKNLWWHMLWSRAWACCVSGEQHGPFSPEQALGPKAAIQAVSLLIQAGILLISVGVLTNVRAMVSLYENHPNKLILDLTMIWLFSKIPLVCNFQWLTGLCRGVI